MKREKPSSDPSFTMPLLFAVFLVAVVAAFVVEPWLRKAGLGSFSWLALLVVYIAIVAFILKRVILRSMATGYALEPMTLQQFVQAESCTEQPAEPIPTPSAKPLLRRQVDVSRIESLTADLLPLGFQLSREGRLQTIGVKSQSVFVRLFEHPGGSLATVLQLFTHMGAIPVTCTVQSSFEDDWGWADTNAKRNWLVFMMRRPRMLGAVHPVEANVADLWTSCERNSEKMQRELQVKKVPLLANEYEAHLTHALPQLKAAFRRKNIIAGIIEGIWVMPKTIEWWGEYARYAGRN